MRKLKWSQVTAWRMRRQYLDQRAPAASMLAVASRLCGLHAQLMSSAELTMWARIEGLDRHAVQRALWEERTLVKTWAMRGTLHLLPACELAMWHAALSTIRTYLKAAAWQKYFGLTLDDLDRLTGAVATALEGRVMTRGELVKEVARITGSTAYGAKVAESSWGTILKPAAFTGRLCFAPSEGQRVRFTRPDTWLGGAPVAVDPGTATAAVTRGFLAAYGPATYHDLARWWGGSSSISTARQWIQSLGAEVSPVEVEGSKAWILTVDSPAIGEAPSCRMVRLLPGFDQYVVAASCHVHHLLPGDFRRRVFRPQGWISPVLLVNGRIEGTWRHTIKGKRVDVAIEPFGEVRSWARRKTEEEADRLAQFLGCSLRLTWS